MTAFLVVAAVLLAAALLWVLSPLVRPAPEGAGSGRQRALAAALGVVLPALAAVLYATWSSWDWDTTERTAAQHAEMDSLLQQLEARLQKDPQDLQGWLMLGRSSTARGEYARAADAYQRAYDLSRGENLEAVIGLGEALILDDESTLTGRAGELFDVALTRAPEHPKALWYGSMAALARGDLQRGRERLNALLTLDPPEEVRDLIARQVQALDEQIAAGTAAGGQPAREASAAGASAAQRRLQVSVSIAPDIQARLDEPLTLYVLARDPAGGPPLAVQRHSSSSAPLTVELTEDDAMIAGRSIASVPRVQVVARLSQSGSPQEQSGDFYGMAEHDFSAGDGTLTIVIDRTVP